MTSPVDIRPDQLEIVQDILLKHLPAGVKVWVFGSRANWTTKDSSDLDLALGGESKLSHKVLGALKDAFEGSALPYTVDVVDLNRIGDSFRKIVESQKVLLPVDGEGTQHVPSGKWRDVITEDIAEKVAMGPFGSSIKVETFVPEGVPVISGQHLHGFRVDDAPGFNFISPEHAQRLANANVHRGDVVFTHAGNIGQAAYIPEDSQFERYVISQRQFYLRCDRSKALPEFVALYFRSPEGQHQLLANTSQVGVPSIAQPVTYLRTIRIPLPSLPEQQAIAHVLGTLDDKIELNRRMNETLEAMAQALYKSWFVKFEPVRAKMEGRWRPGESLPGLPAEHYDLFPDRLVDSEMGRMPDEWTVKALGDFGDVITGKTPSTKQPDYYGEDVPFLRIPDMHGRMYAVTTSSMLSHDGAVSQSRQALPLGSISVSCIATPGLVILNHRETHTNQQINSIVPNDMRASKYLYWSCRQMASEIMSGGSGGSVFHNMNKSTFSAIEILDADIRVIRAFEEQVSPLHEIILSNERQSQYLAALRDALLPKLVSGEVRVKDSERFLTGETR